MEACSHIFPSFLQFSFQKDSGGNAQLQLCFLTQISLSAMEEKTWSMPASFPAFTNTPSSVFCWRLWQKTHLTPPPPFLGSSRVSFVRSDSTSVYKKLLLFAFLWRGTDSCVNVKSNGERRNSLRELPKPISCSGPDLIRFHIRSWGACLWRGDALIRLNLLLSDRKVSSSPETLHFLSPVSSQDN